MGLPTTTLVQKEAKSRHISILKIAPVAMCLLVFVWSISTVTENMALGNGGDSSSSPSSAAAGDDGGGRASSTRMLMLSSLASHPLFSQVSQRLPQLSRRGSGDRSSSQDSAGGKATGGYGGVMIRAVRQGSGLRNAASGDTSGDTGDYAAATGAAGDSEPQQRSQQREGGGLGEQEAGAQQQQQAQQAEIPQMTIFCAPKPYTGEADDPQRRALLSWLQLTPPVKVVLLGRDASFDAMAAEFPGAVSVEPFVDSNFYGVPLFHSIVERARAADTPLSMVTNGDIILLHDIMPAVRRVHAAHRDWMVTSARWDVEEGFPFVFERRAAEGGRADVAVVTAENQGEVREYVREKGSLHSYGGVDFWLWNNSPIPLFNGTMPPFAFGRGKYDNWLTHEAVAAGTRHVIDASDAVTAIHVAHSYEHVADDAGGAGGSGGNKEGGKAGPFWSTRKQSSWELFANIHLAQSHGTYSNQMGTSLHTPYRLAACEEPSLDNVCLLQRKRPANCSCEYSAYVERTQSDPKLSGHKWQCGSKSVDRQADFEIRAAPAGPNSTLGLPHTLEQLLPEQATLVGGLRVVTLVAITAGYTEMLMNFVCRLRRLGLGGNLVVAALDEEAYRFAFTQGLATYYEEASESLRALDTRDCTFGTPCFRQFTKLKSRAVLRVLRAGVSVLWSDVDIVWFSDPLPDLMAFGAGTLPVQSNEPNGSMPGHGIRRINSGFYFARSDAATIEAFGAIVAHAAATKLSEQPSFYDVLCGAGGERLVAGKEECLWTNGLRTVFLGRQEYPNGAVHGLWDAPDVSAACRAQGCRILHNNWIAGADAKVERLKRHGVWHYSAEQRMCLYDWHPLAAARPALPAAASAAAAGATGKGRK
eukprot:jgi/Mesen1/7230/ME000372S06474